MSPAGTVRGVGAAPNGFDFEVRGGEVVITHHGKRATVLRGARAQEFLDEVGDELAGRAASSADAQLLMARVTGNYRRGNERMARQHPRNRAR